MTPHPSPSSTSHSVVSRKPKNAEMIQGLEVEIAKSEQGFEGSWYIAKIIRPSNHSKNKFLVEYKDLLDAKGSKQLKEYIHFRNIRPLQLTGVGVSVQTFQVNQEIDAFHDDGWWKGVITEVLDDFKYKVCFQPYEEEVEVQHSNLRLHMEWIDGNWVDASQHQEVTVVRQNSVVEPPHTTDSLVRSTTMAAQPSSSFDNFCENIMASSRNTSGGMDCESTAHQTDLLSGHVKGQKNVFQSTPKRDDQFFRSSKTAVEGEKTEFSMNSSASHARGKPIRIPIDREAQSVLSLTTTKGKRSKRQNKKGTRTPISSKQVLPLPYGRLDADNHSPSSICKRKAKDDFEQNTCGRKLPLESSPHLSDGVKVDHIVVALPTQQMKEKTGEESVSNKTPNVVKRKRGKPKGSCIEQKNVSSESQVLVLSSESEGLENQSTKKKRNHVQTECIPAVSPTPKDHQTPTFLVITDTCVAEDNGGNVDGAADNELATARKNGTSGPTAEEDLQHSLCPEDPNTPPDGGEAAKTDLTAVQKDHAQLLSLITEEHHSPLMVEVNGEISVSREPQEPSVLG